MKVSFVLLFCIQSIYIAVVGGGSTCPRECPATYDPVCGSDGNTYGNECFLLDAMCHNNRLSRANLGACPGTASLMPVCNYRLVVCYAIWDPICALDGHTYSSPCRLNAKNCGTNHIRMNHTGACDGDLLGS